MDPDTTQQSKTAPAIAIRSYSLEEVAALYLPKEWNGVLWLSRRLRAGEIAGYKVGRVWRMTDEDVAAFVDARRRPSSTAKPAPAPEPAPTPTPAAMTVLDGLSPLSRRRVTLRGA